MSNIIPHNTNRVGAVGSHGGGTSAPSRYSATGRELARVQNGALVRAVELEVEARLSDMKIGVATGLGTSAQQHVATMTAMEGELMKAVPLAATRLEMIGNLTAIAATEIVTDAVAKLRRI